MKHSKWIAVIFTILNIALVIICGIILFRTDRISPEFKFRTSELVYKEDTTESELLEGITASDNRDGNVTDRIVIEKIIKKEKESSVVIFYAVSDTAGNVMKTSRIFPAFFAREEVKEEQAALEINGAEAVPAAETESADTLAKEDAEEESIEEEGTEEKEDTEDSEEDKAEAKESAAEEQTAKTETEVNNRDNTVQQSAETGNTEQTMIGTAPVMTLKVSEVTTKQGITPAWVDVIGSLKDDTDNYETLFSNLSISKYDVNTVGDYKVSLTVTDSNKNTSKPVTLTIHVK